MCSISICRMSNVFHIVPGNVFKVTTKAVPLKTVNNQVMVTKGTGLSSKFTIRSKGYQEFDDFFDEFTGELRHVCVTKKGLDHAYKLIESLMSNFNTLYFNVLNGSSEKKTEWKTKPFPNVRIMFRKS